VISVADPDFGYLLAMAFPIETGNLVNLGPRRLKA
jgi:hypothetical protein